MRRSAAPDFHHLDSKDFEEMCCALLSAEAEVTRADLYMSERKGQHGIDVIGETATGPIVISCKVRGAIGKTDIATWSTEFTDHFDTVWKPKNAKRFILAVTHAVNSPQRHVDFQREIERFKALGLEYDIWAPRQLQEKLRSQPGIVSQYCGKVWVERICGQDDYLGLTLQARTAASDINDDVAALRAALYGTVEGELANATENIENGDLGAVDSYIAALRASPTFDRLSPALKARVIRLSASVALNRGQVDRADALRQEADLLEPQDEPRLAANIALLRYGPDAARETLGTPSSDKGRNLLAGILLGQNEVRLAEAVLDAFDEPDTAEHLRLRSYCALVQGHLLEARRLVERALAIGPLKRAIQRLRAIIRYAEALSPLVNSTALFQPQPVARALVRRDDASQAELKFAVEVFSTHEASEEDPSVRHYLRLWHLASLCNLEGASTQAQDLVTAILADSPADGIAIGWAMARGLTFDDGRSVDVLRDRLGDGTIDANGPRVLTWLVPVTELEPFRELARECAARSDLATDVSRALEDFTSGVFMPGQEQTSTEDIESIATAIKGEDFGLLETRLDDFAARTPTPPEFFMLAEQLAIGDHWDPVYRHRAIVLSFQTADAATLAILACNNTGHLDEARDILDVTRSLHPQGKLPFELRRLEAHAHLRRGDLRRAIDEFRQISAESAEIGDKLLEAQLLLQIGDARSAAPILLTALAGGGLDRRAALTFAQHLMHDDRALAVQLWQHAVRDHLPDEIAPAAFEIGARLGIEDQRPELIAAFPRLAETGQVVRFVEVSDIVAMFKDRQQAVAELSQLWISGRIPAHVFAEATNTSFAYIFELKRFDDQPPRPMFIRSGARPLIVPGTDAIRTWAITVDPAGLILAQQLGLLDILEGFDHPIAISPSTVVALLEIEATCRPHQPSRVDHFRELVAFLDLREDVLQASPDDAIHVAFGDDNTIRPVDVLQSLADGQWLSAEQAKDAFERLGPQKDGKPLAALGASLVVKMSALEEITRVGLLASVAKAFRLFVDRTEFEGLKRDLRGVDRQLARADMIAGLRARLRDGLLDGRYRLLPTSSDDSAADDKGEEEGGPELTDDGSADQLPRAKHYRRNALERTLVDCMNGPHGPKTRVWIDDRLLSGFPQVGTAPGVGVVDILAALRADGHLSAVQYFDRLHRLRDAGALFIPISVEEVMHALAHVPLWPNGGLIETPRLAAIRRNLALGLSFGHGLKFGPFPDVTLNPADEHPYLVESRRLAESVITAIWNFEVDGRRAAALSDWVWQALRIDVLPLAPDRPSVGATWVALAFSSLISGAWEVRPPPRVSFLQRRRDYLTWVSRRAEARMELDPALLNETARIARTTLARALDVLPGMPQRAIAMGRRLVRATLEPLFPRLRDAIADDPEFQHKLGVPLSRSVIIVAGHNFDPQAFWRAAAQAYNYGTAKLRALDTQRRATMRRDGDRLVVRVRRSRYRHALDDAAVGLLSRNIPDRLSALEGERQRQFAWPDAWDIQATTILRAREPARIMAALTAGREANPTWRFDGLFQALQRGANIDRDRFDPPDVHVWLNYIGYRGDGWRAAVDRLRDAFGEKEAFRRCAGLPIDLTAAITEAAPSVGTWPLSPLDAIYSLRALPADCDQGTLEAAFDVTVERFERFGVLAIAVLRWTHRTFERQIEWGNVAVDDRLAAIWTYAGIMVRTVAEAGSSPSHALEFFERTAPGREPANLLKLERGFDDNLLLPMNQSAQNIGLAGLEYALANKQQEIRPDPERLKRLMEFLTRANDQLGGARPLQSYAFLDGASDTWLARPISHKVLESGPIGDGILLEMAKGLVTDPYATTNWVFVAGTAGAGLDPATTAFILEAANKTDVARFLERDDGHHAVRAFADLTTKMFDQPTRDRLLSAVPSALANWVAARGTATTEEDASAIMESAAMASRSFDGSGQDRFANMVIMVLAARPDLAPYLRQIAERMVYFGSIAKAERLWWLVNELRAR